ncbi:hypothetical protein [Oleisolibacter albus]|nr:hypothetical protein [Oleisolibacter albus]
MTGTTMSITAIAVFIAASVVCGLCVAAIQAKTDGDSHGHHGHH